MSQSEEDHRSERRKRVDKNSKKITCTESAVNKCIPLYLEGESKYPVRVGNRFVPYLSGEGVFTAIAKSIQGAKKSIDIVNMGFDPAMPMVRTAGEYTTRQGKNWREEDTLGYMLLEAVRKNPNLKIRIVLWRSPLAVGIAKTIVGLLGLTVVKNIERGEKETGVSKALFESDGKSKYDDEKEFVLRDRNPDAQAYSAEWFKTLVGQGKKGLPEGWDRIGLVFRRMPKTERKEEAKLYGGEVNPARFPSDHQKVFLVDYEDDSPSSNPHAYIMGHNFKTEYWSDFNFTHYDPRREMDHMAYHDFSVRVEGPLLVDLSQNFCEAWCINRTETIFEHLTEDKRALDNIVLRGPRLKLAEDRAKLDKNVARFEAGATHKQLGQIVRSMADQTFPGTTEQEKEIKDAYMQATRHVNNYLLIVNQYCQYDKLIQHIKYWWGNRQKGGREGPQLYIFMVTCKPEQPGQVFRAHQMANELGLGHLFPTVNREVYKESGELTRRGTSEGTNPQVLAKRLEVLGIKPIMFMPYTQISAKGNGRIDKVAQQVYVHGKLMVQDDIYFTIGSANLNIRSFAIDSELNLISNDRKTASNIRKTLFELYSGLSTSSDFPNKDGELEQAELEKIYLIFKNLAAKNARSIVDHERIQGHLVDFLDTRPIGVRRM